MWETILNLIIEQWPFLALLIVAIIATFVIVWHFSKWYYRFEKVEEKVDDLPCEKHDDLYRRFVNTEEKVKELPCSKHDEVFHDIKEQLVEIRAILILKNPKVANAFSQKSSPRELNEAGLQLFRDVKGEEFLNENKDIFLKGIENKNPKTALDVEESALEVLFSHTDNDMFIKIINWIYNSPTRKLLIDGKVKDYAITMNDVCFVLSLPLRNMYLDLHTELKNMD